MKAIDNFLLIGADRPTVPVLCVVDCGASRERPAARRVVERKAGEAGPELWRRVQAMAQELADRHPPGLASGFVHFMDLSVAQYVQKHGAPEAFNQRAALRWLLGAQHPVDTRLWAATKLAHVLGLLPADAA